jgi:hypothetical protein
MTAVFVDKRDITRSEAVEESAAADYVEASSPIFLATGNSS